MDPEFRKFATTNKHEEGQPRVPDPRENGTKSRHQGGTADFGFAPCGEGADTRHVGEEQREHQGREETGFAYKGFSGLS